MCEGHANRQQREYREDWEQTRWMTFHLLNIQLQRKDKLKRLSDLIRFPWEKQSEYRLSTREEFDELCRRWGKTLPGYEA